MEEISMGNRRTKYVYLFAVTYYVGGKPEIDTEHVALDHPVTPEDIREVTQQRRRAGYERALVISFSLYEETQS
jgi:hypothetical protein